MRTFINATGLIAVLAVLVLFCVININSVEVSLYYKTYSLPLCVLILAPLGCGVVAGCLLDVLKILKLKQEVRRLKKELGSIGAGSAFESPDQD